MGCSACAISAPTQRQRADHGAAQDPEGQRQPAARAGGGGRDCGAPRERLYEMAAAMGPHCGMVLSDSVAIDTWPLAVRAQPKRARRIGVLAHLPATAFAPFFSELRQLGFIEGQNLAVDRRGFNARYDQLSTIAAGIMKAAPEALLCGGDAAIRAAQTATSNIPIVAITDDMVGAGLVRSLAHPGGNLPASAFWPATSTASARKCYSNSFPASDI